MKKRSIGSADRSALTVQKLGKPNDSYTRKVGLGHCSVLFIYAVDQQHVSFLFPEFLQQRDTESETNSSLGKTDPQLTQIKEEEEEELCASRDVVELVLKQETDSFMMKCTYEESESEPNSGHELRCHGSPAPRSREGRRHADSGPTRNGPKQRRRSPSSNVDVSPTSDSHCNIHAAEKFIECSFCGKAFKYKYNLKRHLRIHTGEKPYVCITCGKRYSQMSILKRHIKIHTGEKPYCCRICRKRFCQKTQLQRHINIHTRGQSNTWTVSDSLVNVRQALCILQHSEKRVGVRIVCIHRLLELRHHYCPQWKQVSVFIVTYCQQWRQVLLSSLTWGVTCLWWLSHPVEVLFYSFIYSTYSLSRYLTTVWLCRGHSCLM